MLGVVGRGGGGYAGRGPPGVPGRVPVPGRDVPGVAGFADAGAAAGGCTIRGCDVAGRFAGAGGCAGLIVLTRRGGPSTGAAGLAGSAFLGAVVFFAPPFGGAGVSANMSPPGSEMPRCRATRSTNDRATTSSMVLDALFSSIP